MMKLRIGAFLMVLCFSMAWTSSALSQSKKSEERYKLPVVQTNENGDKCLNKEQWQQVLNVSSQNKGNYEWRLKIEPTVAQHAAVVADLERVIKHLKLEIDILQGDRKFNHTRIKESEDFALEVQKSERRAVLGWKITAGAGWLGVLALAITALAVN